MPPIELKILHRSLQTLDYTRKRMEALYSTGEITKRDLDSVYEALFLRAVTSFESFLEELFLAILERRTKYKKARKVAPRMTTKSRVALTDIVFQNRQYLNWIPFNHTEERAMLFLADGKPFSDLETGDRAVVKTITTIRHAIAHRSKHSMREFERTVTASHSLLWGERSPAGFLRSRVQPSVSRFEVYVGELARIGVALCLPTRPQKTAQP